MTRTPSDLVLGTVQLGKAYGRRAAQAPLSQDDAFAILNASWAVGMRAFDTAESYGDAPVRLAAWLDSRGVRSKASVVTKVRVDELEDLEARAREALEVFEGVADIVLLTHGAPPANVWRRVRDIAQRAGARAGESVYTPAEVSAAADAPGVARIQAPGNLFDSGALEARANLPVPLDLRSVYLQGVLLEPPEDAERRAPGAGVLAAAVQRAAQDAGADAAPLLLAAGMIQLRSGDRLVVGVDRAEEVEAVRRALALATSTVEAFRQSAFARVQHWPEPRVFDPRSWPVSPRPGAAL